MPPGIDHADKEAFFDALIYHIGGRSAHHTRAGQQIQAYVRRLILTPHPEAACFGLGCALVPLGALKRFLESIDRGAGVA